MGAFEYKPPRREMPDITITAEQREKFLSLLRANRVKGTIAALREAGVQGTKGQIRRLLEADDGELADAAADARGHNIHEVEDVLWTVARNPEHPSWERAAGRLLKAYDPKFREHAQIQHEHVGPAGGPIEIEDRSASLADLARVLEAAGALAEIQRGSDRPDVPAARPVLPAPSDD